MAQGPTLTKQAVPDFSWEASGKMADMCRKFPLCGLGFASG